MKVEADFKMTHTTYGDYGSRNHEVVRVSVSADDSDDDPEVRFWDSERALTMSPREAKRYGQMIIQCAELAEGKS